MALSRNVIEEKEDWVVKEIFHDDEFSHYVLKFELDSGTVSVPFDEVYASGGLLNLNYEGSRSCTFSEVIDGSNRHKGNNSDMPVEIFGILKDIGPY